MSLSRRFILHGTVKFHPRSTSFVHRVHFSSAVNGNATENARESKSDKSVNSSKGSDSEKPGSTSNEESGSRGKAPWWTKFVPQDNAALDIKGTLKFSVALIFGIESFRWLTSESKDVKERKAEEAVQLLRERKQRRSGKAGVEPTLAADDELPCTEPASAANSD